METDAYPTGNVSGLYTLVLSKSKTLRIILNVITRFAQ